MPFQPGAVLNTQGFGNRPESVEVPHLDTRAPTSSDYLYPVGKYWVNSSANTIYFLTSQSSSATGTTANWQLLDSGASALSTLTDTANTVVSPVSNNIKIAGTTNQVTSTAGTGTITLSVPTTFTSPGSVTATTSITASNGAITATNGNFVKGTAGNKDVYSSVASTTTAGANSAGTVTLVGGTATISTTAVTASSIIRLYRQGIGATGAAALGILSIGTISAGVSFVINAVQPAAANANQASDVSVVAWEIVN